MTDDFEDVADNSSILQGTHVCDHYSKYGLKNDGTQSKTKPLNKIMIILRAVGILSPSVFMIDYISSGVSIMDQWN